MAELYELCFRGLPRGRFGFSGSRLFGFGGLPRGLLGFCSSRGSLGLGGLPLSLVGFSSVFSLFFGGRPRGRLGRLSSFVLDVSFALLSVSLDESAFSFDS
ncbi:MAG: hypothetical protein IJ088_01775, partial [Clostridia bacterium]|nr:hypothetical protein [Clostridia bacterium]